MSIGSVNSGPTNFNRDYNLGALQDSLNVELKALKAGDSELTIAAAKDIIRQAPQAGIEPTALNRILSDAQSPSVPALQADYDFVKAVHDPASVMGSTAPSLDLTQSPAAGAATAASGYPVAASTAAPSNYPGAASTTAPSSYPGAASTSIPNAYPSTATSQLPYQSASATPVAAGDQASAAVPSTPASQNPGGGAYATPSNLYSSNAPTQ